MRLTSHSCDRVGQSENGMARFLRHRDIHRAHVSDAVELVVGDRAAARRRGRVLEHLLAALHGQGEVLLQAGVVHRMRKGERRRDLLARRVLRIHVEAHLADRHREG